VPLLQKRLPLTIHLKKQKALVSNLSLSSVLRIVVFVTIVVVSATTCLSQKNSIDSDNGAAIKVLIHLRTLRDCWNDPYMVIVGDDPRSENDTLYRRCGSDYLLLFDELQESVSNGLRSISRAELRTEMVAANEVLNDLYFLQRLFNSRAYYVQREIQTSDVASILRKYNINVRKKTISKVTLYQEIIPHRRLHIDRFAALIRNAPPDNNPTLTPEEIAIKVDEMEWALVTRQGRGYDWYLRRHPQGRHAEEARKLSSRQGTVQSPR
jgi:hypothetical protein